jgi:exodeoxyribonuclease VII large subunit
MTSNSRIDLTVPYVEKEDAKAFGARWDSERKIWYAPPETNLENLQRWLPKGMVDKSHQPTLRSTQPSVAVTEKVLALSELLDRVKGVIERGLPDAVWVRAEISELRGKNGHLYLTLSERNERGDILAQMKGVIWKNRAEGITAKFEGATSLSPRSRRQ